MWGRSILLMILVYSLSGCSLVHEELEVEPMVELRVPQNEYVTPIHHEPDSGPTITILAEPEQISDEKTDERRVKDLRPAEPIKRVFNSSPALVKETVQNPSKDSQSLQVSNQQELAEQRATATVEEKSGKYISSQAEKAKQQELNQSFQPNFPTIKKLLSSKNSEARHALITHAVIHFTSNAKDNPSDPFDVDLIYEKFEQYGVSAHYLIDRQGNIYELVSEARVAYHAGAGNLSNFPKYQNRLNHHSIGIELMAIGTEEEMSSMLSYDTYKQIPAEYIGYTSEQYEALTTIINDLTSRYPHMKKNRQHIIGHDEYARGRKTDPGSLFDWGKIGL